jgi:hypothetical protein
MPRAAMIRKAFTEGRTRLLQKGSGSPHRELREIGRELNRFL